MTVSEPKPQRCPAVLDEGARASQVGTSPRPYDGVLFFGGVDWWYHNRGHYDIQMAREFSVHVPVVYINSIGMRVPRVGEGRMFLKRVTRKLGSLRRGMVRVRDNFWVASPLTLPAGLGAGVNRAALAWQAKRLARRAGMSRPLVWVACPPAAAVLDRLGGCGLVYQRTDRFEDFKNVDRARIAGFDRMLKGRADVTLFCSSLLMEAEGELCRHAAFVDHGCDFEAFAAAGRGETAEPADLASVPRPRVGFVGGIDAHTFDPELFVQVARSTPDLQYVMVGACSLPEDWCSLANVHLLGQRPYDQVASYMAACDVLIMPWNRSPWIEACNPVKLKEYLAVGRPIVSTPFYELKNYGGFVRVATDAASFAAEIRGALADPYEPTHLRERARSHTWSAKADAVIASLSAQGIVLGSSAADMASALRAPDSTSPVLFGASHT